MVLKMGLCKPKIKICGITNETEVEWLVNEKSDFMGVVLFFPKSKRNVNTEVAKRLVEKLKSYSKERNTKPPECVAVVVSPSGDEVESIQKIGFDYIQIHGQIHEEVIEKIQIPVFRAINVNEEKTDLVNQIDLQMQKERKQFGNQIKAWLFDAAEPGSGKAFDWQMLSKINMTKEKLILAGGLLEGNVSQAIEIVHPDIVDVSSGVEIGKEVVGKDYRKIKQFIGKVRGNE